MNGKESRKAIPWASWINKNELWIHAVNSGFLAAVVGVLGKVCYDNDLVRKICTSLSSESYCHATSIQAGIHVLVFGLLAYVHIFMFKAFNSALRLSTTSLEVTVINSATNFLITGLFGYILFGESLKLSWWIGISFIISGSIILIQDEKEKVKNKNA